MREELVNDELWELLEPLLPEEPPKPKGGRPRVSDRAALTGIVFVLKTGTPWELLPGELGWGSGMTCWRRLRDWQQAGMWQRLHAQLLECLAQAGQLDWSRVSVDSCSIPAPKGGNTSGQTQLPGQARHQAPPRGRPGGTASAGVALGG